MAIKILSGIRESVTYNALNLLFKQSAVNFQRALNFSKIDRTFFRERKLIRQQGNVR